MDRKLFLTSTGLNPKTLPYFIKLLAKNPLGLKATIIPTAGYPKINPLHLKEAKESLEKLDVQTEIVDLKRENPQTIKDKLKKTDIINIGGGNTFFLLYWVRKCGLDKYLEELLDQGKIYLGISAGSILAGPSIAIAGWKSDWDKNVSRLRNLGGLKLVPFAISPHYTNADKPLLEKKSKTVGYPIVAINDFQAVKIINNKWEIVGKGEKVIFKNKSSQ
ncbi:Type 1 glutamine amidotransferase-like domain-containing protein [Candidatus Shapirobacteria bacterium]|nr:Type 1 glutamine amidotransferase-like domain-containing protein [Candidatus Shapirobacteria bacterium]